MAYFMNDFRAVYLPGEHWYGADGLLAAIAEEIDEDFELVLGWPAIGESQTEETLAALSLLKNNISCIVLDADACSEQALDATCRVIGKHYSLNLAGRTLDTKRRERLHRRHGAGFVWRPGEALSPHLAAGYQVVLLPCLALREMKTVLDQLRPLQALNLAIGIFLAPAPETATRALEVRTVIELTGMD